MKAIKDLSEVVGKTIKSANVYGIDDAVCFIFDDGSYLALEPKYKYEDLSIELVELNDSTDRFQAGLIDEETYASLINESEKRIAEVKRQQDLEPLARLKAKYEGA